MTTSTLRALGQRLFSVVLTLLGLLLLTFVIGRVMPLDPVLSIVGPDADRSTYDQVYQQLGLDRPLPVQFAYYLRDLLHGDLGKSIITQEPVLREFAALFPATVELALCAIIFALLIGIPAGIIAAVKRNSALDHGVMGVSLTGYSMPIFWWGLLLILLFSVQLGWTPVSGRIDVRYFIEPTTGFLLIDSLMSDDKGAFWSTASHLILPTIVLGTNPLAVIARMTRSAMLEVLGEDYIRTARAKGLIKKLIVNRHALKNALLPVVTLLGIEFAFLIGGLVITEQVFNLNGIGRLLVQAVQNQDNVLAQALVMLVVAVFVMTNLVVDVLYAWLDPRIRFS